MEHSPVTSKLYCSIATQTDLPSNKGKCLDVLDPDKHQKLFKAHNDTPTFEYRENKKKVFINEFLAQDFRRDLTTIIDIV